MLVSNSAAGKNRVGPSGRKSGNRYFVTAISFSQRTLLYVFMQIQIQVVGALG